jgi:glucose-6-phosphate isomerase
LLLPAQSSCSNQAQARLAIGNCLAQAEAFALGYSEEQAKADLSERDLASETVEILARHKVHAGSRPVSIVAFEILDAQTLGRLVSLYEHKVFAQSVLWGINAFDQWGVELGKKMCEELLLVIQRPDKTLPVPTALQPTLDRLRKWSM